MPPSQKAAVALYAKRAIATRGPADRRALPLYLEKDLSLEATLVSDTFDSSGRVEAQGASRRGRGFACPHSLFPTMGLVVAIMESASCAGATRTLHHRRRYHREHAFLWISSGRERRRRGPGRGASGRTRPSLLAS